MSAESTPVTSTFAELGLPTSILKAIEDAGYKSPSPIQETTIPVLLKGRDVVGQAQTGTGKTAAFALPILTTINPKHSKTPQAIILAPTRELAIQVAEAFKTYSSHMKGLRVLPIYGGQPYSIQLRALKQGVHVVVGTPGRVMDHIRRGTLRLDAITNVVLDEADEMLRMGFIDDVEWILEQIPETRQIALFSATMPKEIRRIAQNYLTDPEEIIIKVRTSAAETIRQRVWNVGGMRKTEALARILEAEPTDGVIVFVRTKSMTVEVAEQLENYGYAVDPLNGDIAQKNRERTVERLKKGYIDIVVATDVAARGLDVERISHVINFDIPFDTESYVHRIGRTGRAGRAGEAILFVGHRERGMLRTIERVIRQTIEPMQIPTASEVNKQRVNTTVTNDDISFFQDMLAELVEAEGHDPVAVAAALAQLLQGEKPFLLTESKKAMKRENGRNERSPRPERSFEDRPGKRERSPRPERSFEERSGKRERSFDDFPPKRERSFTDEFEAPRREKPKRNDRDSSEAVEFGMERFRIEVGRRDRVKPGNIVGAIANEAGLDGENIGAIEIFDDFSTVDLPEGMPKEIFRELKATWVCNKQLNISRSNRATKRVISAKKKFGKNTGTHDGKRRKDTRASRSA